MSSFHSGRLRETTRSTDNIEDLIPILTSISIDKLKETIYQNIDEIDAAKLKTLYFTTTPINEIIPAAIIQHIFKFNMTEIHTTKLVNKQWYKLSKQNEKNQYLELQQSLDENSPIKYNKNENHTWILHPRRNVLTEIEKSMGLKGPINPCLWDQSLSSETFEPLKSGDRLFIHNGYYKIHGICLPTTVSIIGMDDSRICAQKTNKISSVCIGLIDDVDDESVHAHVYIERIRFQNTEIYVPTASTLSLNKCEIINGGAGIVATHGSSLNVENCIFNHTRTAIEISPLAGNIRIENNIFKNGVDGAKHACIRIFCCYIYSHQAFIESGMVNGKPFVKLMCVGNVFENNSRYPIAERAQMLYDTDIERRRPCENPLYIDKCELYELRDNVVKIDNSNTWRQYEIYDANKIYFIEYQK